MGYCLALGGYGGIGGNFLGSFWWLMPLLFWGTILTSIVLLFKSKNNSGRREALAVLQHEYALGKISREDFLQRKKDLK
ncbi:hypothetical protein [Halanaerobium hydrogeniformans]|uniref:SHOCT domain-containing protein n=1 Tax=Halanaerobium hydrogeniformans TaxID=656519 RepID=E4RIR6_HALHG|nr:hypothetical protein [Halanaerobium hydrogeniformans]ADQ15136.1 Protein of unknown function DUF2078, membrane [Halanaerobium hydrogeniformans]